MSLATADLPSDPDALRAFAAELQAALQREIAARDAEIHAWTLAIEKLKSPPCCAGRASAVRRSGSIATSSSSSC